MKYHPDKMQNASEEEKEKAHKLFQDINEANSVLSDPKKRQTYDLGGYDAVSGDGGFSGAEFHGANIDPS